MSKGKPMTRVPSSGQLTILLYENVLSKVPLQYLYISGVIVAYLETSLELSVREGAIMTRIVCIYCSTTLPKLLFIHWPQSFPNLLSKMHLFFFSLLCGKFSNLYSL